MIGRGDYLQITMASQQPAVGKQNKEKHDHDNGEMAAHITVQFLYSKTLISDPTHTLCNASCKI